MNDMQINVTVQDTSLVEHSYYKGDTRDCPPLPQVGNEIMGSFGKGKVTQVRHYREGDSFNVVVEFSNTEAVYEHTGF